MLTSKQRAEFRAQANSLETTLMVGKDGVTEAVVAEADKLLTARELVKGKVLETALMSAREVSDAICDATGADGISCVGSKFVIWRFSEKCQAERNQTGRAKHKETPKSKADPVGKGVRARRQAAVRRGSSATSISGSRPSKSPLSKAGNGSRESRNNPNGATKEQQRNFSSAFCGINRYRSGANGTNRHLRWNLQSPTRRPHSGGEAGGHGAETR